MTTTNVDRLVEERLDLAKLTDAYERNGLMGVQELARSALSQARQEGREEAFKESLELVDKQLSALTTEGK